MSSSRSPEARRGDALRALLALEWRELFHARTLALFLALVGPLVGHAFITAVGTYAEASGAGGGPAALAQGVSPLDGLVVPTLGAYALLATLILPFVAIRTLAGDKRSGALALMLQSPLGAAMVVAVKLALLLTAWLVALVPGLVALALWRAYGGHLSGAEVATVLAGHALRAVLTIAIALAAAALSEGASSAAIVVLAVTLGTWALDFVAQVRGGLAQTLAAYTPEAALRTFESGEIRLSIIVVTLVTAAAMLALAVLWSHPGRTTRARAIGTLLLAAAAALGVAAGARARWSGDTSEARRNSFPPAAERALAALREPLRVTVNLAPEDPRLADLERSVLRKLRRTVPDVRIAYASRGSTGLFERPGAGYGEVWYEIGGRRAMSRSTTEPIVLETIFDLARVRRPDESHAPAYPGYPLVAHARGAAPLFYLAWPLLMLGAWAIARRRAR